MHPSYLSLYVSFAFFILVSIVSDKWKKQNRYQKILYFVWLFFLFFMIFYIRSRMGVISFILVAFLLLLRTVSLKKAIISIITLLILGFAGFMVIEKTNFNKGRFQLDQVNESLTLKKLQAEASLKVFKENMIFGVSLSNEKKEMLKQYEEINFEKGISNNYNSHNQYLNVLVHSGMVGFGLLFFPVFKLFKKNIKLEELSFLLLSFFSFFTESFLERHKGIVWFVFFLCFFINQNNKN
jgi:O-antigen ligase